MINLFFINWFSKYSWQLECLVNELIVFTDNKVDVSSSLMKDNLFFVEEIIVREKLTDFIAVEYLPNLKKISVDSQVTSLQSIYRWV